MVQMLTLSSRSEWLEKRKSYIGGSEAACLVGMNPYQTNVDLWELKTGRRKAPDLSDNPHVQYGAEAEKHLRELFKLDFPQYDVRYDEFNIWTNSDYPFAHASLDGWLIDRNGRRGVLEIKTATIQGAAQAEKWKDRIPDNYFCQVLWYMAVTEAEFAVLKAQLKYEHGENDVFCMTRHYFIEREDCEDDVEMLMDAGRKFAEYLVRDERPPLILPNI